MRRHLEWLGLSGAVALLFVGGHWHRPAARIAAPPLPESNAAAQTVQPATPTSTLPVRPVTVPVAKSVKAGIAANYGQLPIAFEPNVGQAPPDVKYLARGRGYGLYLTETGATISVASEDTGRNHLIRMRFENAIAGAQIEGKLQHPGYSNYFLGNRPDKWYTGVPHFGRVEYTGVYNGIDLVYYGNQSELEYDIVVAKGADPNQVSLSFEGIEKLRIDDGDLILVTRSGELKQRKPFIYQRVGRETVRIDGRYVIRGKSRVAFEVEQYDRDLDLVIDPVLVYSTFLGGISTDFANGIAVDNQGSAYIAGGTDSSNFPELGPQTFVRAGFVTKLSPAGNAVEYTTFIGGSATNWAKAVAVDGNRNAYVTGLTTSTNFPSVAPFQASPGGGRDGFVAKLNPAGNTLLYSSYLGGSGDEFGSGIAVDSGENAYVTGTTVSSNFPTAAAVQATYGGAGDAFLTKINPAGTALVYSTFIGGDAGESGERVAVDAAGAAYVTGGTNSTNFPAVAALQATNAGGLDAFVTKVNPAGSAFSYSTYLGGSGPDSGLAIAVDASGAAYVAGYTHSTDFRTQSPLQPANGGAVDGFVSKLNAAGSALVYSTYLGGSGDDYAYGIAVDTAGNAYATGLSASTNFPTAGSINIELGSGREVFLSKYNTAGSALLLSFRYGGTNSDEAADIALDGNAAAYIVGSTASANFPVTLAGVQPNTGGAYDGFVSKIGSCDFSFSVSPDATFQAPRNGGPWSVSVTAASGCPWVASSTASWVSISSGASGNGNGTVQFSIQSNPTQSSREAHVLIAGVPFTIQQSSGPALSSTPGGLTFFAYYNTPVTPQNLQITLEPSASTTYTATAQTTQSGGNWLSVSPASGNIVNGSATLSVSINPESLNFDNWGQYNGVIQISSPGATNILSIPVTVSTSRTFFALSPDNLAFAYSIGSTQPSPRTVTVNSGSSASVGFTVSSAAPYLQVSPASGTTTNGSATFNVAVNPSTLEEGVYLTSVTVTPASGFPVVLPVRVVIDSSPAIAPEAQHIYYTYYIGDSSLYPIQVPVRASNGEVFYSAQNASESSWLSVSPTYGYAPDISEILLNPSGLPPGEYEGAIIYEYDGVNSGQYVYVHLTVVGGLTTYPSELTFTHQQGASNPPAQTIEAYNYTGYSLDMQASAAAITPVSGTWLQVSPSAASGSWAPFSVSVTPGSLPPGTYTGEVTIASRETGIEPAVTTVTLYVTRPVLYASPGSISRTYSIGQGPSGDTVTESVSITSGGSNIAFNAATTGGSWLTVTPSSSTTPGNLTVTMNPAGLTPGTYNGMVTITSTGADSPIGIPVTFVVQGLSPAPSSLTFGSFQGAAAPPARQVALPSLPSTSFITVSSAVTSPTAGTWLSAFTGPGTNVSVSVNPAGLPAGDYTGSVTITPADFPARAVTVPVTYVIAQMPALSVPVTPLTFNAAAGATNVPSQTVTVTSIGSHLDFRLAPTTSAGGNWLDAYAVRNGTTPAEVTVAVKTATLAPGAYSGNVIVTSANDPSGAKIIPVNFTIDAAFTVSANPTSLSFGAVAGSSPGAQSLAIRTTEQTSSYTATANVATPSAGTWLSVSPASGAISPTPTNLSVSIDTAGLSPGSYSGSVVIAVAGAGDTPVTVPVNLTVVAPLVASAPCPAPPGIVDQNYSLTVAASGGVPSYTWSLFSGTLPPGLSLNTSTGVISGTTTTAGSYPVTIRVTDSGGALQQTASYTCTLVVGTPLTITAACPATVASVNNPYTFPVSATGGIGTLTWQLISGPLPNGLSLNTSNGLITGTPSVAGTFQVTVQVRDSAPTPQTANYICDIVVVSAPQITAACPAAGAVQGRPYSFPISVTGGQGPYDWQLTSGSLPNGLTLNTATGSISGTPSTSGEFEITVTVTDSLNQTATYTCRILVTPTLAFTAPCPAPPALQQQSFSFTLTTVGGFGTLSWELVESSLPSGLTLSPQTGVISGTPTVNGTFPITVRVTDSATGSLQQTATYTCNIVVGTQLAITAGCPAAPAVQGFAYNFTVAASGGQGPLTWQLIETPLPTGLTLNPQTGVISGTPSVSGTFPITVRVSDAGEPQQTATYTCNIIVTAALSITAPCPATPAVQGFAYNFTITAAGGRTPLSWQLIDSSLPTGLTLNPQTGVISGTPTVSGTFPITVRVSDADEPQQTATYTCNIIVTAALSVTAPCPATPAVQGFAYNFTITAAGGQGALTWQLTSGALPTGLSLNTTTGVISGTPTVPGTFPITIQVTDSATGGLQQTATYTCNIIVTPTLTIAAPCPATTGVQGSPYTFTVAINGGAGPFTYQLTEGPLPPGLSLNPNTGAITGTPTASGTFPIAVQVSDSGAGPLQQTATYTCNIVVTPGLAVTTPCPAPSAVEGRAYSLTLTASGGTAPYTWALATGSTLPAGLTLDPNGVIGGTPTVSGTFPVSIQVTDTPNGQIYAGQSVYAGQSATYTCNLVIVPTLRIGGACTAAQGTVGVQYSFSLAPTGGTAPYTFAFSGQLPPGLSFNPTTGQISGTPTGFGTFDVSITVTDAGAGPLQQTQTFNCAILIGTARLRITSACPTSATVGTFFTHPLTATGGDGTYLWSISTGVLPEGLRLIGNELRGTPTGPAGIVPFSLQVESDQQNDSISCSINITAPAVQITSGCPGNGIVGTPYGPFNITAIGGSGPGTYSFSIVNGTLPSGVTLASGIISGTPQGPPGTSTFTIQAASGGQTGTTTVCTVNISAPALQLTGVCPESAFVGSLISTTVTASGGQPPYNFSFTGSPFLSFNNGTISGTPTQAGTADFSVSVTDSANAGPQTFSCSFPVNVRPPALEIGGACPQSARVGTPLTIPLTAGGGTPPYAWTFGGPTWLTLSAASGASVTLSGTPPSVGFFDLTVTLSDSANSTPATFACTITVNERLEISAFAGCPTGPIAFQAPISISAAAAGGAPPYAWSLSGPPWLTLGSSTGPTTTITGSAGQAGAFIATLSLSDGAAGAPVTVSCPIVVNPPVIPTISFTGLTPPQTPLAPVPAGLTLAANTPVPLRGTVRLTFAPNARNPIDNPQVHFSAPCLRECPFTVEPGTQNITLPNVEPGSVAGTIRVEIVELFEDGRSVLPSPAPFRELVIPATRPVITSVTFDNERPDGFDIVISGFSPTREISTFTLTFTARPDATIQGDTSITRDISALFDEFYRSSRSFAGGSIFEGLRIPISIGGSKDAIGGVSVILTNGQGPSEPVTRTR